MPSIVIVDMYTVNMSTDLDYPALLAIVHRVDLLSRRVADQQLLAHVGVGRSTFLILELLSTTDPFGARHYGSQIIDLLADMRVR